MSRAGRKIDRIERDLESATEDRDSSACFYKGEKYRRSGELIPFVMVFFGLILSSITLGPISVLLLIREEGKGKIS